MRSAVWPLLKVQLLNSWRGTTAKFTGTKSRWGLLLLPLIGMGFIPLVLAISMGYVALYTVMNMTGQGHILLTLALTAGQLVCLVFGILYVISAFYFSKDLSVLVPLPVRPGEIVLAKFVGILIGEYLSMAPIVLPALVAYGLMANVSWLYIPFAVIIYLLLPVVPLVLAALFSIVLMRVTNMRRNRDLLRVFGGLLGVGLALFFQFMSRMQQGGNSQQAIQEMINNQQPLIQSVSRYVVTSVWATNALREDATALGFPSFLLYTAVVVVALLLMLQAADRLFFGGLLGGEETRSSGRQLSQSELAQETGQVRSPLWALFLREVRLLNRTPSFLMAGVLPPILMPFFMIFPLTQKGGPLSGGTDLSRMADSPWVPLIVLGATLFLNTISAIPSSAISREGRWFWISRSLPIPPRVQVQAKMLHALLFSLFNVVIAMAAMIFLRVATPLNLAYVLVGGALAGIVSSYSGLLVDIFRPHLTWTDPQQAMKGNFNSLFTLVVNLLLALVTGGVAALLYWLAQPALMPGLLILLAIEGWALGKVTGWLAEKNYMEYEF